MSRCKRCGDIKEDNSSKYCNRCKELLKELKNPTWKKVYKELENELKDLGLREDDRDTKTTSE